MADLAVCAVRCAGSEPAPADMGGRVQEAIPLEDEAPVAGVTLRLIEANGIEMRIAEAGQAGPMVLLVHGWPESWYSWRHQLPALAEAGYRVLATTGARWWPGTVCYCIPLGSPDWWR